MTISYYSWQKYDCALASIYSIGNEVDHILLYNYDTADVCFDIFRQLSRVKERREVYMH